MSLHAAAPAQSRHRAQGIQIIRMRVASTGGESVARRSLSADLECCPQH